MRDPKYIECACGDCAHVMRFNRDNDDKQVYVEICVNPYQSFWKRTVYAIMFIFSRAHKYCHFDTFILYDDQRKELIEYLTQPWDRHESKRSAAGITKDSKKQPRF